MCLLVCFPQGGTGVPFPRVLALMSPSFIFVMVPTPPSDAFSCDFFRFWGYCVVAAAAEEQDKDGAEVAGLINNLTIETAGTEKEAEEGLAAALEMEVEVYRES